MLEASRPSGVSISPGISRLVRMCGEPSTEAWRQSDSSAALDAPYAGSGSTSREATEPTSTIEPPPVIASSACLQPRNCERRFTAITRSQSSTVVPRSRKPAPMPTFNTSPSIPPRATCASSNMRTTSASSAASPTITAPSPPSARTRSAVTSALAASMSATATAAPSRANRTAMARPLPIGGSSIPWSCWPPPTINTRRPSRRPRPGASPRASSVRVAGSAPTCSISSSLIERGILTNINVRGEHQRTQMCTIARVEEVTQLPRGRHRLTREEVLASQRGRMLEAMAHAVLEKGYVRATVADVLSRARVSRETFYEHFADKEDCFLAAYELAIEALGETIAAAIPTRRATPLTRLRRALGAYLDALAQEGAIARVFLVDVYAAGPRALARRREVMDRFVATM